MPRRRQPVPRYCADTGEGKQHVEPAVQVDLQPHPMVVTGEIREILELPCEVDPLVPVPHRRLGDIGVHEYSPRYATFSEHRPQLILHLCHQFLRVVPEIDGQLLKLAAGDLFSGRQSIPDSGEDDLKFVLSTSL